MRDAGSGRSGRGRSGRRPRRGPRQACRSASRRTIPARATARSAATYSEPVTDRISLAIVLHNHQPVGNFGWVIAEAYERAYLPMVDALERHPGDPRRAPLQRPAARLDPRRATGVPRPARRRSSSATRSSSSAAAIYEPVLVAAARARPARPARPDGRRGRADRRPSAARGVARRARLGAGPADVDRRRRLPLDDRRRRPLPGGGARRRRPVGAVRHRGPGPAC